MAKQIDVPMNKVLKIWNLLGDMHAIINQAREEGLVIDSTTWEEKYKAALDIDNDLWKTYHTPIGFFINLIDNARKRELTFSEMVEICRIYKVRVTDELK